MHRLIPSLLILSCPTFCMASSWDITGSLGISQPNLGNNSLQVTSTETDSLIQTRNPWAGDISAGLLYLMPLKNNNWFPELRVGVNYRYISNKIFDRSIEGTVLQYQEPEMNNYTYMLDVSSNRLMADALLTVFSYQKASIFAMAGVGAAWNDLSYRDKFNPGIQGGNVVLNGQAMSQTASEFGAGLFWQFTSNLKGFAQYLYSDLGSVRTQEAGILNGAPAAIPSMSFPLRYNTVLLGFNYHL